MSSQLKSFLTDLAEHPDLLADFHANPHRTLANHNIGELECQLLIDGNLTELRHSARVSNDQPMMVIF